MNKKTKHAKKRSTLAKQIGYKVILFVAVIFTVMMGITMMVAKAIVVDLSNNVLNNENQSYVNEINGWVDSRLSYMNGILGTMKNISFSNDIEIRDYLASATNVKDSEVSDIYIGDARNWIVIGSGFIPDASFSVVDRPWYKLGINVETMTIGEAYVDANSKEYIVSISSKVKDQTVLSADVSLKTITDQVKAIHILNEGYAFLVEKSSDTIIAHNDSNLQGKKLSESGSEFLEIIGKNMDESQEVMQLSDGGNKYFVKMLPIENTEWVLVSCATYNSVMGRLDAFIVLLSTIGIIILISLLIVTQYIIKHSTKSIHHLTEMIHRIAEGDFTKQVQVVGNNEITTIAESLNQYIVIMKDMMAKIMETTKAVSNEVVKSNKVAKIVYFSANVQKEATGQMNEVVSDISKSIDELAGNATTLASAVSEASVNGKKAKHYMEDTVNMVSSGKQNVIIVSDKMNEMTETMAHLQNTVRQVSASMKEINQISELIGGIATQTNLLSLNASIEAARAGEAGKGFAVVASEIGQLSAMSSDAALKISKQIEEIDKEVADTVLQTSISVSDMTQSKESVDHTVETLSDIFDTIRNAAQLIESVSDKITEVDNVASNMAAITQEQSASTEELLSSTEELHNEAVNITDESTQINESANRLSGYAQELDNKLESFKI